MLTASFREVRLYDRPVPSSTIEHAAGKAGMRIRESTPTLVHLRAPLNLWSYGESVEVALGSVDGKTIVDIASTCAFRLQIADWGKNERNVRRIFDEVGRQLGDGFRSERCNICRQCGYLLVGLERMICPECGRENNAGEAPTPRDVASYRTGIKLAAAMTALEYGLLYAAHFIGLSLPGPLGGIGARQLLFLCVVNASAIIGTIACHRLVRRHWFRPPKT